jgi:hypothetical protein
MSDNREQSLKHKTLIVTAGLVIAAGAFGFGLMNAASGQTQTDPTQGAPTPDEQARLAEAQKQQAATSSASSSSVKRPITRVDTKPVFTPMLAPKNVLLRKALPPAPVQWQNAMTVRDRTKSARKVNPLASRLSKKELDRTRLPVLMPRDGGVIDTAKAQLMSFGDAYVMDLPQSKGAHFAMFGNRTFVKGDKGAITARPFAQVQGMVENVQISRMEDGWTATFTRYGVVYSVDMMCDDINGAECATDALIRKAIADCSDVTMGAEAESEAQQSLPAKPNWFDQTFKNVQKSVNSLMGGQS